MQINYQLVIVRVVTPEQRKVWPIIKLFHITAGKPGELWANAALISRGSNFVVFYKKS